MKGATKSRSFSDSFSTRERGQGIARAKRPDHIYDICVIGGGITGAAIARDACLRGLSVLLLEKNDFAHGTSSRSSKLVHGGVRYLEQYEFKLVIESTRERARLWKLAPSLVSPLPFLFPCYEGSRVPLWKLGAGLWLYDLLAQFRLPGLHKKYYRDRTLREEPGLKAEGLKGAIFYWDGATNDALLTLSNIVDAYGLGATILSRSEVSQIEWQKGPRKSQRLQIKDQLGGQSFTANARVVVSAAGPWTDTLLASLAPQPRSRPLLAPTRGSHIVVAQSRLPTRHAVTLFHPQDGRVLFSIPWGECTIVGTTDLFDHGNPDKTTITSNEVDYLLVAANHYFPKCDLKRDDVISTWSGLRPLLAPHENAGASQISREHHLEFEDPGLLVIAGGKLTTHREMAEAAVDKILRSTMEWPEPLLREWVETKTRDRALPAFFYPQGVAKKSRLGESEATALSLDDLRGICLTQMVFSLEDLLVRRTAIFYKEPDNGWALLSKIKDTVCEALGWNAKEWARQKAEYKKYIDQHVTEPLGR